MAKFRNEQVKAIVIRAFPNFDFGKDFSCIELQSIARLAYAKVLPSQSSADRARMIAEKGIEPGTMVFWRSNDPIQVRSITKDYHMTLVGVRGSFSPEYMSVLKK